MSLELSKKAAAVKPSSTLAITAKAKELKAQGKDVVGFGAGEPDFNTPENICNAAIDAIKSGFTKYTPASGTNELKEAISKKFKSFNNLDYAPDQIVISNGGKHSLTNIFTALINPGDEVIVFAPYFVEYNAYVRNYDGNVVIISPDTETFMPKLDEFEAKITARTKAVIINNPNNPTGVVYDEATIKAMAAIMEKKEKEFGTSIVLISDEPYRELAYGGVEVPFVTKYYHNAVVGYSYSKSLSVPGERIGYVVIPDEVDDSAALIGAATIANRVIGCVNAPSLIQKALQYCIQHDVTVDLATSEKNRNLIYGALTEYGFTCAKPDGAFYLFVKSPVEDEKEFCEVAKKHHVLVVPGSSFACPGYVRLAYCVSYEQIERSLPAFKKIAEEYGLCK